MGWQYRPRSPADEANHTLTDYELRLRAAEATDRLEVNLGPEAPGSGRFNRKRLRIAGVLWTIGMLAVASVATWFLDRVVAAEIVAVLTPIAIFMTPRSLLGTPRRDAALT
jgi:hypothetical protein